MTIAKSMGKNGGNMKGNKNLEKTPTLALCLHEQAITKIHLSLHSW